MALVFGRVVDQFFSETKNKASYVRTPRVDLDRGIQDLFNISIDFSNNNPRLWKGLSGATDSCA